VTTLAILLAVAAQAAPPLRCPKGTEAALTGHPLRPLDCEPSPAAPAAEVALDTTTLPDGGDAARAALKALEGRWRGTITAMADHFEVSLDVTGSGKSWAWSTTALRGLQKRRLGAEFKTGPFAKRPPYDAVVTSPDFPERSLAARVWTGAAPLESGKRPELDRLAVWTYAGKPGVHRVQYALAGNKARGIYTYVDPKLGPIATSFELTK
jgi:hypothetical protein